MFGVNLFLKLLAYAEYLFSENGQEKFIGKTVYIKATDWTLCGICQGKTDGHDILD